MPATKRLVVAKAALDGLGKMPLKVRRQLIRKIRALPQTPRPQGSVPLKGVESDDGRPVLRYRSGDYRILYVVRANPDEVVILDIGNRKDVYRGTR